jgi:hypothetical protein
MGATVPTWVMVLASGVLTVSLIAGLPLARAAGKRRGRRLAHPELFQTGLEKAKDTALFLAALVPSTLVWLAVMTVSFIGLTGFAADVMHWRHWTNTLVPLSLDGISISFGAWAFVAVKRGRHPGRAYKIVLAAATMSAALNFVHGRDVWSLWAGLYLAFLSVAGMAMFHELLDQFMAAYDEEAALRSRYPRFGQRWLYAPLSTFAARRAWIVHPPQEGLRPSVRNALDHLEQMRQARRHQRLGRAVHVQEMQQAKLIEIHSRNQVKAAKRSHAAPWDPQMPAPQPMPAAEPAAATAVQEPLPQEVEQVFDRLREELTSLAEPPLADAQEAWPGPEPVPIVEAEPEPAPLAEPEPALLAEPELEQQRWGQTTEEFVLRGPDVRPILGSRVREILDAQVRPGDDLTTTALTNRVLRALGAPANRDSVHDYVAAWVNDVQLGIRSLSAGPRPPAQRKQQTRAATGKLEFPFELLALQRVFVGANPVTCPGCGTQESLLFTGFHKRRPVEARCGCGQRWPIVGLGSSRLWEVLADEMAAGKAQVF